MAQVKKFQSGGQTPYAVKAKSYGKIGDIEVTDDFINKYKEHIANTMGKDQSLKAEDVDNAFTSITNDLKAGKMPTFSAFNTSANFDGVTKTNGNKPIRQNVLGAIFTGKGYSPEDTNSIALSELGRFSSKYKNPEVAKSQYSLDPESIITRNVYGGNFDKKHWSGLDIKEKTRLMGEALMKDKDRYAYAQKDPNGYDYSGLEHFKDINNFDTAHKYFEDNLLDDKEKEALYKTGAGKAWIDLLNMKSDPVDPTKTTEATASDTPKTDTPSAGDSNTVATHTTASGFGLGKDGLLYQNGSKKPYTGRFDTSVPNMYKYQGHYIQGRRISEDEAKGNSDYYTQYYAPWQDLMSKKYDAIYDRIDTRPEVMSESSPYYAMLQDKNFKGVSKLYGSYINNLVDNADFTSKYDLFEATLPTKHDPTTGVPYKLYSIIDNNHKQSIGYIRDRLSSVDGKKISEFVSQDGKVKIPIGNINLNGQRVKNGVWKNYVKKTEDKIAKIAKTNAAYKSDGSYHPEVAVTLKKGGFIQKLQDGDLIKYKNTQATSQKPVSHAATTKEMVANDFALSEADKWDLGALTGDVAGLGISAIAGVGNVAAAATGVGSTLAGAYADHLRGASGWDIAKNLGMNLGLDAATLIPGLGSGAKAGKLLKGINIVRKIAQSGAMMAAAPEVFHTASKAIDQGVGSLTASDWRTLVNGAQMILTGKRAFDKKFVATKKTTTTENSIGYRVKPKEGEANGGFKKLSLSLDDAQLKHYNDLKSDADKINFIKGVAANKMGRTSDEIEIDTSTSRGLKFWKPGEKANLDITTTKGRELKQITDGSGFLNWYRNRAIYNTARMNPGMAGVEQFDGMRADGLYFNKDSKEPLFPLTNKESVEANKGFTWGTSKINKVGNVVNKQYMDEFQPSATQNKTPYIDLGRGPWIPKPEPAVLGTKKIVGNTTGAPSVNPEIAKSVAASKARKYRDQRLRDARENRDITDPSKFTGETFTSINPGVSSKPSVNPVIPESVYKFRRNKAIRNAFASQEETERRANKQADALNTIEDVRGQFNRQAAIDDNNAKVAAEAKRHESNVQRGKALYAKWMQELKDKKDAAYIYDVNKAINKKEGRNFAKQLAKERADNAAAAKETQVLTSKERKARGLKYKKHQQGGILKAENGTELDFSTSKYFNITNPALQAPANVQFPKRDGINVDGKIGPLKFTPLAQTTDFKGALYENGKNTGKYTPEYTNFVNGLDDKWWSKNMSQFHNEIDGDITSLEQVKNQAINTQVGPIHRKLYNMMVESNAANAAQGAIGNMLSKIKAPTIPSQLNIAPVDPKSTAPSNNNLTRVPFQMPKIGLNSDAVEAGRAALALATNNKVTKILNDSVRPVLADPIHRNFSVYGDYATKANAYGQAADYMTIMGRNATSNGMLNQASLLEAATKAGATRMQGNLADSQAYYKNMAIGMQTANEDMATNHEVAFKNAAANRAAIMQKANNNASNAYQRGIILNNVMAKKAQDLAIEEEKTKNLTAYENMLNNSKDTSAQLAAIDDDATLAQNTYATKLAAFQKDHANDGLGLTFDKQPFYTDYKNQVKNFAQKKSELQSNYSLMNAYAQAGKVYKNPQQSILDGRYAEKYKKGGSLTLEERKELATHQANLKANEKNADMINKMNTEMAKANKTVLASLSRNNSELIKTLLGRK